jgi:hypothetical protein
MHLTIIAVGVLLAGCAEADKHADADAQRSSLADGQASPPPGQIDLPMRRLQGLPSGRYGRPATRIAPSAS